MSKYKATNILISFRFALRGLMLALRSQRNFRIDILIGFEHNKEIDTYIYSGENIDYLHLDFLVSIHSKEDKIKQFFIRYDENNSKYILNRNYPISKHFFSLIKSVT